MKSWVTELLNELKKRHGMSGRELALGIGVSKNSLSDWLTGKEIPGFESKKKIADFCVRSVDELEKLERGSITLDQFFDGTAEVVVAPKEVKRSAQSYSLEELLELTSYFSEMALQKASQSAVGLLEKSSEVEHIVTDNSAGLFFSVGAEMDREVLRELVRHRMKALGLTESEFAKRCFLSLKVFRQVLAGEQVPNLETKLGSIVSELVNPDTQESFGSLEELAAYCQQKSSQTCQEEGSNNCCVRNGKD